MLKQRNFLVIILGSITTSLLINYCNAPQKVKSTYNSYNGDIKEAELENILNSYFTGENFQISVNLDNYFKLKHIITERPDLYEPWYEEEILTNLARKYNALDGSFNCIDTSYFTPEEK